MKINDRTQAVRERCARQRGQRREGYVCFGVHPNSCADDCAGKVYRSCSWAWRRGMDVAGAVAVLEEDDDFFAASSDKKGGASD